MKCQTSGRGLNDSPDNILGEYYVTRDGEESRVMFTKEPDGTYKAQVFWVNNDRDKNGNKRLDLKNPDKNLRSTPCDRIVIVWNLKYDSAKKRWSGGRIYDPTRGIRANVTCSFNVDGNLMVKGSLMGISETAVWIKEKQPSRL